MRSLPAIFILFFALAACSKPVKETAPAAQKVSGDTLIVPGERVGLLKPGMSAEEIRNLYGSDHFLMAQIPIPEGQFLEGAKIFAGTDRELDLIWNQEASKKTLSDINVVGAAWTFSNGLKVGMTLLEVEKLNGKPFRISGFDWDYGGYAVDFQGGSLQSKVSLRFTYGESQIDESLIGDKSIPSTDPKLRALNPKVEAPITVNMTPPSI